MLSFKDIVRICGGIFSALLPLNAKKAHACPQVQDSAALVHVACEGDTADVRRRVEEFLQSKNIRLFAVIDHAANAASVQMEQEPATVMIFGNPAGGTPLMRAYPLTALILPLKVLIRSTPDGQTWLTYHDMTPLALMCGADPAHPALAGMNALLGNLAAAAATAQK